jgi:GR25 family glycosyltransferase involved in LPS biosynthesis
MKIDKIFIINLKNRLDRKKQIIKELQRVKLDNYEFFRAVKPHDKMVEEWCDKYIDPLPQWFINSGKNPNKYRCGALGCLLSHYEIIKISKERGYKNILILEDDTKFEVKDNETFIQKLESYSQQIDQIENIYGLLYLVGNHGRNPKTKKQVSQNLIMTRHTLTTGSYIISDKAMDLVLENIKGYKREIDVFYIEHIQQKLPCFFIYPHLAGQVSSYSDIAQRDVNYKL